MMNQQYKEPVGGFDCHQQERAFELPLVHFFID